MAKPPHSPRSRLRGPSLINDSYRVNSVTGQMNSMCYRSGRLGLSSVPVAAENSKVTLNVDSHVANAHIVTGLPQRKGVNPTFLCQLTCQSADIMSSLCGVGVRARVRVNNFSSKTTRPRDVLFFKRYLIYRG